MNDRNGIKQQDRTFNFVLNDRNGIKRYKGPFNIASNKRNSINVEQSFLSFDTLNVNVNAQTTKPKHVLLKELM